MASALERMVEDVGAWIAKAQRKEGTFGTLRLSPIAQKRAELTAEERAAPLR